MSGGQCPQRDRLSSMGPERGSVHWGRVGRKLLPVGLFNKMNIGFFGVDSILDLFFTLFI